MKLLNYMMKLVYKRRNKTPKMTERFIKEIAVTLSGTNREAVIVTRADPFRYLEGLKEYGISASARPVIRDRKIVGYKFKNVA